MRTVFKRVGQASSRMAAVAGFVATVLMLSPMPAHAGERKASPGPAARGGVQESATTTRVAFTLGGYDVAVANAHGYQIVVRNGRMTSVKVSDKPIHQATVPKRSALSPALSPVISGNCGASFLYYAAQGGRKAQVYTGFDIFWFPVVHFTWTVAVTDRIGVGSRTWTGHALDQSWDTYWTTSHGTSGYSYATVVTGTAVLINGSVCYTGHPGQSTNLY